MRRILLLARNDLRLTVRDRWSFLWMLLLPLAMTWFFGLQGRQGSGPPKFSLTVVDRDGGWIARAFVGELAAGNVELHELAPAEADRTEKKVRTLVLPEGFTAHVLAGERQTLRLEKDEGAANDYSRAAEVHVVRAIARTLALLVEMRQSGSLEGAAPEFARLQARDPLVRLDVTTAGHGTAVPGGLAQSVPGILTMIVLMNTVIYGGVFLTLEKREGMLRRQVTAPVSRAGLFTGKIFGRLLVAGLQTVVLVLAGRFLFHLDLGPSPGTEPAWCQLLGHPARVIGVQSQAAPPLTRLGKAEALRRPDESVGGRSPPVTGPRWDARLPREQHGHRRLRFAWLERVLHR